MCLTIIVMEPNVNCAITKGYFQQVRFLLELGSSPNCRDENRRTPLINCALIEDETWGVGLARTLMEKGAAMSLKCCRGMNVLHYACIYGRNDFVQVLLRSADFDIVQADRQGNTPLHYAAAQGYQYMVITLIDAMRKYHMGLDTVNMLGFTALMQAWRGGHELTAKVLLSRGADVTPRDYVEMKTAEDYEQNFRQHQHVIQQMPNRPMKGFFLNLPQHRRPISAMSNLSGSSFNTRIDSASHNMHKTRSVSANLLERRKGVREREKESRRSLNRTQPNDVVVIEDYLERAEKDRAAGRMIHSASHSNLRNKPEQLLNISPTECFMKETRFQSQQHPSSMSPYHGDQNSHNIPCKSEVKKVYNAFQFQFTKSYCKPACLKEPDIHTDEYRAVSPMPSDYGLSDKGKKHRKSTDKISLSNEEKLDKKARKTSAKSLSRKSSTVSTISLKSQQTLVDCSSNESVNSSLKNPRKFNSNETTDSKVDKTGKHRSRKLSSALEDHVALMDQSAKSSSRSLVIPTVNEPTEQDQLGAIRE